MLPNAKMLKKRLNTWSVDAKRSHKPTTFERNNKVTINSTGIYVKSAFFEQPKSLRM